MKRLTVYLLIYGLVLLFGLGVVLLSGCESCLWHYADWSGAPR